MISKTRSWRVVAGGVAAGIVGVLGFAGATATADPLLPVPPAPPPAPVTVTQPVTVAPALAGTAPAPAAVPVQPAPVGLVPATTAQPVVAPHAPALVPASSGTLREYLKDQGVELEPQDPRTFRALQITLPLPTGWTQVPDPNVPDAYAVIADRTGGDGLYTSNAQVVIYKLVGDFDANEAITHGFVDSQQLTGWQSTDASLAEFSGFPASLIEGTYRDGDLALNTSRRYVIATGGPDRYLVSLAVTTAVNQVVATADATDAIVNGFRVTDPAAAPPAPAPGQAAPVTADQAGLPGLPAAPPPAS